MRIRFLPKKRAKHSAFAVVFVGTFWGLCSRLAFVAAACTLAARTCRRRGARTMTDSAMLGDGMGALNNSQARRRLVWGLGHNIAVVAAATALAEC